MSCSSRVAFAGPPAPLYRTTPHRHGRSCECAPTYFFFSVRRTVTSHPSARACTRRATPCACDEAPSWRPSGLLREAVEIKQVEVALMEETVLERPDHPIGLRMSFYSSNAPQARFTRAVRRADGTLGVVAMLKRFHPVRGGDATQMAALESIGRDARALELAGADAAMVNTDVMRYGCEVSEVQTVTRAVARTSADRGLPVARHDLIVHPIQIAEAAVAGACAVIIVAAAALADLLELLNAATAMGVEAVVECHTELERDLAIECGATLLLLTNWDRTTNSLCPGRAQMLRKDIPAWVVTLGGGGIVTASDAWEYLDSQFDAVVIGGSLLQSRRPDGFIREIRTQKKPFNPFAVDLTNG